MSKRNLLKQSKADFSDRKSRLSEISADSNLSKVFGKDEHLSEYLLLSVEFPGCGVISSEQLTLPKSDIIVIYTLIIYPASENLVTAAFPLRSRVASERMHPNLKKVNIFRSQEGLHILS